MSKPAKRGQRKHRALSREPGNSARTVGTHALEQEGYIGLLGSSVEHGTPAAGCEVKPCATPNAAAAAASAKALRGAMAPVAAWI